MEINTLAPYEFVQNDSVYDYAEGLCNNGFEAEYRHVAIPIILITVIVLSVIGNILVVVISVFCMRLRSLTSIFILNSALSDLLFTVGLIFWVCEYFWGWTFGDAACYIANLLLSAGFYSSIMFLVLMSNQQYITTDNCRSAWMKERCFTLVLMILWLVSILAALPATLNSRIISDPGSFVSYCTYSHITVFVAVTYEESIIFVCAFLIMAFCYIRILPTIYKSPTNQKHRTTGLVFLLVATFFMFWAPYIIVNFLHNLLHHDIRFVTQCEVSRLNYASYICQLLAFTRCCLNPVIYGLTGVKFHKTVREVFQRRATLNCAQMSMLDQVPEQDISPDFHDL